MLGCEDQHADLIRGVDLESTWSRPTFPVAKKVDTPDGWLLTFGDPFFGIILFKSIQEILGLIRIHWMIDSGQIDDAAITIQK